MILYRNQIETVPFIEWIFAQGTIFQFWTPDCLRKYGCGTPNGALWTIGVMVQCYFVLWIFHKLMKKRKLWVWIISLCIGIVVNILLPLSYMHLPILLYKLLYQTFIPYFWIFILGAMISEFFELWIELFKKYWFLFLIMTAIVSFTKFDEGVYGTLKVLFLAPAVIGFAYRFSKLNIKLDFSYGFYIYHMVVINVMIELGFTKKIIDMVVAWALSIIFGIFSYYTFGFFSRIQRKKLVTGTK